jgi:hypothetical protein
MSNSKMVLAVIGVVLAVLMAKCQQQDAAAIIQAQALDRLIAGHCEQHHTLPARKSLLKALPQADWLVFGDESDHTWLKVQYPVSWWHTAAPGTVRISEFTATPYAYTMEYRCVP